MAAVRSDVDEADVMRIAVSHDQGHGEAGHVIDVVPEGGVNLVPELRLADYVVGLVLIVGQAVVPDGRAEE